MKQYTENTLSKIIIVNITVYLLLITLLFSFAEDVKAKIAQSFVAPALIHQAENEYKIPTHIATMISMSVAQLPIIEQNRKFTDLIETYQQLYNDEQLSVQIKKLLEQGSFKLAIEQLKASISNENSEQITHDYYVISMLSQLALDRNSALAFAEKLSKSGQHRAEYYRLYGKLLLDKKQYKKAVTAFKYALQYDQQPAMIAKDYYLLGLAWYGLADGRQAIIALQKSLDASEALNSAQQAKLHYIFAQISQSLGNTKIAIQHAEIAEKKVKKNTPLATDILFQLAVSWKALANKEKTIQYLQQSIQNDQNIYGRQHPLFAYRLINVGEVYRGLGQADQAIKLHQQALLINQSIGVKSHLMAKNYSQLAKDYQDKKDTAQAISYFRKALDLARVTYGENHPMVAIYYGDLAYAWFIGQQYKKSMKAYQQALDITQKNYGTKHREVPDLLRNIGLTWEMQGDYQKATKYFHKALNQAQEIYGKNSPKVTAYMDKLGYALNQLGHSQQAEFYHQQALKIDQKAYGKKHANVARDYSHLASALVKLGRVDEAAQLHKQALDIDLSVHGGANPYTVRDLNNLGQTLKQLGKLKESVAYQEKALLADKKLLGRKHQNTVIQENNLSVDLYAIGKADKAKKYLSEALALSDNLKHAEARKIAENMKRLQANLLIEKQKSR